MHAPSAQHWRNDITGLRALAVLPVLLFHAFPSALPGGFFGVDVFFVISGYLIAGIIFRGLSAGTFSFADFYAKRIKRILPTLILVILASAAVGWRALSATEYATLGKHMYSSILFFQHFRLMDAGYFDIGSHAKPLLHLWSLAIEEQFYILFPILCALLWRYGKRPAPILGAAVLLISACSFVLCLAAQDPTWRFYFPGCRCWEIGAGATLAYLEVFPGFNAARFDARTQNILSVGGFVAIVTAMAAYDTSIPSPSAFNLLPVLGAVAIIAAGSRALINRTLLAWRPMTFIGLISYALYLWHWPIISFLHITIPQAPAGYFAAALCAAFLLAVCSYFLVENPVRRTKRTRPTLIALLLLAIGCVLIGQTLRKVEGVPSRPIAQRFAFQSDWSFLDITQPKRLGDIEIRSTGNEYPNRILFLGDSHVEQYAPRVKRLTQQFKTDATFLTFGGCLLASGKKAQSPTPLACQKMPDHMRHLLASPQFEVVVVGQKWGTYMYRDRAMFTQAIERYKTWLSEAAKTKRIFVLLDAPWGDNTFSPESCIPNRWRPENNSGACFRPAPQNALWMQGNDYVRKALADINVTFIEAADYVCPQNTCDMEHYKDDNHLRSTYTERSATWIDPVFESLKPSP